MTWRGDIRLGDTLDIWFTTRNVSGVPTSLLTSAGSPTGPTISAFVGNGAVPIVSGITLTADLGGIAGLNQIRVVASSGNGFATATNVGLVITNGQVNSVSVIGEVVAGFSIENRSALMPTTAARTLDVSSSGEAGVDWANVGSPTTTVGLTNTTISTSQVVASVTGAVGSVTGSVGSVTGSVGSVTGSVGSVTGAVGSVTGNVGGNVVGSVASVTGNVGGNVTGSVGSIASGGITSGSFAAGAINAAAIATDAIDADALKADAVTEIQAGLATSSALASLVATIGTPTGASIADDITSVGTRRNLTTYSRRFDLAPWVLDHVTLTSGRDAPDGSTTATKLVEDSTASAAHDVYQNFTAVASQQVTLSVYAKAGERSALFLSISGLNNQNGYSFFNLTTGAVGETGGSNFTSSGVQEIGDGWFRCWIKATTGTGVTQSYFDIQLATGTTGGNQTYSGNGTSGAYIWEAQFEVGALTAADTVPKFLPASGVELEVVQDVTDKYDTLLQAGSPQAWTYTADALHLAPTGGGGGSAPTAAEVADAVWDEALAGHAAAGSTGEALSNASAGGDPWSAVVEAPYTAQDLLRIAAAVAAGKTTITQGSPTGGTVTFRDVTDATNIVVANMVGSERAAVTLAP